MAKTRREFTAEFKREAVALLESSGRPQMQVAAELGIQLSMLRQWRAMLNGASTGPRSAGSTGASPPSPVASPSDQAAEIARLRRELDRTRMERDVSKKPSASSRRYPSDLRLHRAACADLTGASHVPRARSLIQWLLRLAVTA
jgi:transposase